MDPVAADDFHLLHDCVKNSHYITLVLRKGFLTDESKDPKVLV